MLKDILFIGLGGGVGSILRYLTSQTTVKIFSTRWFFAGTFAANIIGCFLIGLFSGWLLSQYPENNSLKYLLITGFCGGYTTFSAFAFENMRLIELGQWGILVGYVLLSVIVGIAAVWLGLRIVAV